MATFKTSRPRSIPLKIGLTKIILPSGLILTVLLFFFLHQKLLLVSSVICQSSIGVCPEAVESLIVNTAGQSFLRLNLVQIKKEILATGLVDKVNIKIKIPGQLTLEVTPLSSSYLLRSIFIGPPPSFSFESATTSAGLIPPSMDLAAFVATNSGNTFQLFSSGVLSARDGQTNYFLIVEKIPPKEYLILVYSWLKAIGEAGMKPLEIYFINDQVLITQDVWPDILIRLTEDPKVRLSALQLLDSAVTIKKPKVIDFRYTHPILK
jgi:hypothetical protein